MPACAGMTDQGTRAERKPAKIAGDEKTYPYEGEVWWAALREPSGSEPGYRRPVAIIQSDDFTTSRIDTVIGAAVTSNTRLAFAPGNVFLRRREAGLPRDSVINVSQLLTLSKAILTERIGRLSPHRLQELDAGLRLALAL